MTTGTAAGIAEEVTGRVALALAATLLLGGLLVPSARAAHGKIDPDSPDWHLCSQAIPLQEARHDIPSNLLRAISLAESGRWHPEKKHNVSWPWTVMAEGRGRFLPNKATAIAEVERLRRRGVRNIDVGCMQVNLMYHREAFPTLDDAFDPAKNAAYAASFLRRLRDNNDSWSRAVGYYHSQTPRLNYPYRRKVMDIWRQQQRRSLALAAPVVTASVVPKVEPKVEVTVSPPAKTAAERAEDRADWLARLRDQGRARIEAMSRRHDRAMARFERIAERQRRMMEVYRGYMIDRQEEIRR